MRPDNNKNNNNNNNKFTASHGTKKTIQRLMQRDTCPQHENFGNERYKYSLTVGVGQQLRPIKLAAHITNSVQVPVAYYMLQDTES